MSGHYTDLELTKHGLGILKEEDLDVFFVAASVRKYFSLGRRFYSGVMLKGRWLPGRTPPYYHQRALGFSTYVRGYEYYVVDGQSYALFKSAFKYQILPPRVFTFKWLPLEKFNTVHVALYGGVFFDGARVENRYQSVFVNSMGNRWLYGYGAGLDLVTYYDLVFRLEYAFNHLGQGGLYLHMGAPF